MRKIGIYKIVNLVNNKLYIGSSKNLTKRWYMHRWNLKRNRHHCKHLQCSYNKHGVDNFRFEIIEECSLEDLMVREQYYIDAILPEYNTCRTAGSTEGRVLTDEHKRKIGEANSKKTRTEEEKRAISEFMKTRPQSEETKAKRAASHRGKTISEEHKRAVSKAQKGKHKSDEHKEKLRQANLRKNAKAIIAYNDNEEIHFDSIYDACQVLGADDSSLRKALKGKLKTHKKYKWKYDK